jgi:hypothetical protein
MKRGEGVILGVACPGGWFGGNWGMENEMGRSRERWVKKIMARYERILLAM